jgi:hypothetical protein
MTMAKFDLGGENIGKDGWGLYAELDTTSPNKGAHISAIFPKAALYTVQLSVIGRVRAGAYKSNPMAEIKWMLGGQVQRRLISVTQGCSITGVGEAASITVYDDSHLLVGTDQQYQVLVQVAMGNRTGADPLLFPVIDCNVPLLAGVHIGAAKVGAGASKVMLLPDDVGVMAVNVHSWLTPTEIAANEYLSVALISATMSVLRWDVARFPEAFVPVPVNVESMTLVNDSTSDKWFGVAYKIDG